LLDVSFTTSLGVKIVCTSYHIIHNREGMFYLTRTKHDCNSAPFISNWITNRWPSPLSNANDCQEKLQNTESVIRYIYICISVMSGSLTTQHGASLVSGGGTASNMEGSCEYIE